MVSTETKVQKNIVFIGASSAAMGASLEWCENHHEDYRFIMIEAKTHYNHVFAFPRASVISGFEEQLFCPYDNMFYGDDTVGKVINARATEITRDYVKLDRDVPGFGDKVDYAYLVYTAGTQIPAPGRFNDLPSKDDCIAKLQKYQEVIREAQNPIIIGAGAVGLEMAAEIKEHYPDKNVTLVHSRNRYLPRYKVSMDVMIYNILKKRGVKQKLGDRVILPKEGFPLEVKPVEIQTKSGKTIKGDLAIMCIGMNPNNSLIKAIAPESINPETGFVKIKPTMQIQDDNYPNIFSAGDVCDHTDVKTGHYAWMQGLAVLNNIRKLIAGATQDELEPYKSKDLALIKVILGEKEAVTQTHQLGPLITYGSWVGGRSVPHNVYASFTWGLLHVEDRLEAIIQKQSAAKAQH